MHDACTYGTNTTAHDVWTDAMLVVPHQHVNAETMYKQHLSPASATHLTPCMQAGQSLLKRAIVQSAPQASGTPALRIRTRRAKSAGDPKSPVVSPALPRTGGGWCEEALIGRKGRGAFPPPTSHKVGLQHPPPHPPKGVQKLP
jgi:hypothetical protein